ncbi:putative serine/threonine-protein kinase [Vespula squamosa]|uniref:Serine/threonine-protein kinase n=1 Tax=Vespula squamosa TaxID=30214 RepID=A0ABD2A5J4_VESSQ
MDNMFSSDNIYLRCYFFVIFFATTYAAPGGLGSFAGSNSAAFSSASASAYAGSVASAISSANSFTGGAFPSKNPDGMYGLTHQQSISAGSGSYVGLGSTNPDSNKFGLPQQAFGTKGNYNDNKSQTPCSGCPNIKEKWEPDNYDEQSEEESQEEEEQDDCDDGQYRPEHHYHHHKSRVDKKQEQQTVSSVHKIGNNDQYNYNQANDKGKYTTSGNKGQGNINNETYNNYGNSEHVGANNQNLNNNYDSYQHNADTSKDTLHPSSDQPKKDNLPSTPTGTVGAGSGCTPGISSPACSREPSTLQKNTPIPNPTYGTVGSAPGNVGVGNKPHSYDQQNTGQWRDQPKKDNLPSTPTGNVGAGSGCTPGISSPACSREPSTLQKNTPIPNPTYGTVGSAPGNVGVGNKPHSYDQQNTGQWRDQPKKDNLPSTPTGTVGAGSGCTPGISSPACSREPSTLQKNTPIPNPTYGTVGSAPGNVGVGNKPHSYDQQNTGQWRDQPQKDNLPSTPTGNVGAGSGCTPGISSPACSREPSTLQKNTPIPNPTYGTVGSAPGNVGVGNKPHSYDQQNTGQWRDQPKKDNLPSTPTGTVGAGSGCTPGISSPACSREPSTLQKNTPIPNPIYGTVGSAPGNVGVGNKPHSYDQQNTGQWRDQPKKDNLPSTPTGTVGAGSGCTPGISSPACSREPSTLQKNTPIPNPTYGTVGSAPSNVGVGNKPHSYDQQNTGQWRDQPKKDNLPSTPTGTVGAGSGCTPGISSPACSREPSTLQKNTPIPNPTYGTVGSAPGNVGVGNKPHSYDQQNTGQWRDQPKKDNLPSTPTGTVGAGSGCTPGISSPACSREPSTLQKNTPIPNPTYGTVGSAPGNVGVGNKPHSYDQQNTGHWRDQPKKDNLPSTPTGTVGAGSGCTPGISSPACSREPSTLQKNTPIPNPTYGTVGSAPGNVGVGNKPHSYDQQNTGQWRDQPKKDNLPSTPTGNVGAGSGCTPGISSPACSSEPSTLQKNIPTSHTFGNVDIGPSYQTNKNSKESNGSGNCGTFGSSTCVSSTGYPIGNSQTTVDGIESGHNVHGQTDSGNRNSYQWNAENPFLHGGQGILKPFIHTTSSPIFITNNVGSVDRTAKPIGFGNPFLDGSISNTFGTEYNKYDTGMTPMKSDALNKPIGMGNPFLTKGGNGDSKSSTPIHSAAIIGSISSTSILPSVTTTVQPIGQNNPFLEVTGGNVNKYPSGVYPSIAENNKNVLSGSETSADKDSIQFPKSGVGITSLGTNLNTNRGVKGGNQHNKLLGNVATSNAGVLSIGNVDANKRTGLNIPNAYNNNNNNAGHGISSLTGTANINKPYTLSTSESYGHKDISPGTSKSGSATNSNGNSPSNSLINGYNANGQFNPQITNAGTQSFAGAHAGSFASSFSSSQASSSSSSFASSKSGSYTANGDPNILRQLNGNWPFDIATSVSGASSWPSLNPGSHASAFASSSAGSWSGSEPVGVKS